MVTALGDMLRDGLLRTLGRTSGSQQQAPLHLAMSAPALAAENDELRTKGKAHEQELHAKDVEHARAVARARCPLTAVRFFAR